MTQNPAPALDTICSVGRRARHDSPVQWAEEGLPGGLQSSKEKAKVWVKFEGKEEVEVKVESEEEAEVQTKEQAEVQVEVEVEAEV
jgi:hypothetical protein